MLYKISNNIVEVSLANSPYTQIQGQEVHTPVSPSGADMRHLAPVSNKQEEECAFV